MERRPRKDSLSAMHGLQRETIVEESPGDTSSESTTTDQTTTNALGTDNVLSTSKEDLPRPTEDLDNDQQRAAPEVRAALKKNLAKSGFWSVPTDRPEIHPDDFEDPICDEFWKDKWIASAVRNVCVPTPCRCRHRMAHGSLNRLKSTARSSIVFQTI